MKELVDKISKLEANLEKEVVLKTEVCGSNAWDLTNVLALSLIFCLSVCLSGRSLSFCR